MKKLLKYTLYICLVFLLVNAFSFADDWNLPWITIISRAKRWADESIRLTTYEKRANLAAYKANQQKALENLRATDYSAYLKKQAATDLANEPTNIANQYLKNYYYDDAAVDYSVKSYNWTPIQRVQYYKVNKTKILIHHTASDNTSIKTQEDAIKYIKYVYKYHTLDNARWDIWYNFIIDPFGNIYEGRAWWEWVIWAHAKWNNTPSVWIAMIWNFETVQPTREAVDSLVKLVAALAKKYNINPFWYTYYHKAISTPPYLSSSRNYTIAWHRNASATSCPGENLYNILPFVRSWAYAINRWQLRPSSSTLGLPSYKDSTWTTTKKTTKTTTTKKTSTKLTYSYFESMQSKIKPAVQQIKQEYVSKNKISYATTPSKKILWRIDVEQAKIYMNQNINVLLYELTQDYNKYVLHCEWWCSFKFADQTIVSNDWTISVWDQLTLQVNDTVYQADSINVSSNNNIISVTNYDRKSYAWIPRNSFHWKLIFKRDNMKDVNGKQSYKYIVINSLWFQDYMKWIVETNDTETQTKNNVMALIAKSYALFYMSPRNQHPNIPSNATYNAVDDPNIFQKYVWAGLEKTLTKRYKALSTTQNQLVMYDWYVPILPYFSCSAGFTYSASEKWWWTDTLYLQSRFDLWICSDKKFSWHWVGLSWLWAERRAKTFGRSYSDIIKYYYQWVEIINI